MRTAYTVAPRMTGLPMAEDIKPPKPTQPDYSTKVKVATPHEVKAVLQCLILDRPVTMNDVQNRAKTLGVPFPGRRVAQLILHEQERKGRVRIERSPCGAIKFFVLIKERGDE